MKHIILILLAIMLKFTNVHSQALNEYYDFQHSINLNQKISNGGVNPFIENGTIYLLDSEFSFTDFSEGDNAVLNLMIIDTNYNVKNKQFILYTKRLYNSYLTTIKTFATKNGKIYIHDTKNLFVFDIETQNLLRKFPLDGYFSKSLIKKNKLFLFSAYPDDILDYNPPSKIKVVIYDILEDSYTSKYLDEVRGKALLKVNPKKIFSVSNELIAFADILNSRILLYDHNANLVDSIVYTPKKEMYMNPELLEDYKNAISNFSIDSDNFHNLEFTHQIDFINDSTILLSNQFMDENNRLDYNYHFFESNGDIWLESAKISNIVPDNSGIFNSTNFSASCKYCANDDVLVTFDDLPVDFKKVNNLSSDEAQKIIDNYVINYGIGMTLVIWKLKSENMKKK